MNSIIEYQLNNASKDEIAEYLLSCDKDFIPPLNTRVKIVDYAKKIVDKAMRFEAWTSGQLVGLVAAYCNDKENQIAYITSVNVVSTSTGKGIASHLISRCVEYAKGVEMVQVSLEVDKGNAPAIRLYEKCGFIICLNKMSVITMSLNLRNGEQYVIKKKL